MVKTIALTLATLATAQRAGQLVQDPTNRASAYAWSQYLGQNLQPVVTTTEAPQTTTRRWKPSGNHYKNPSKKVQGTGGNGSMIAKWLPWGAWNACTGLCGNGVQTRVRRCLNGIAGIDCNGDSIGSKKCSDFGTDTCSYWSGWGAWSSPSASCNPARRCKTRTCYGRNTDHCEGPTECCEDVIYPEEPCVQVTHILPGAQCCDYKEPNCGERHTYQQCGPCYPASERNVKIATEAYPLPLCYEPEIWSSWADAGVRCKNGAGQIQRRELKKGTLSSGAIIWTVIDEQVRDIPMPTEWTEYQVVANTCNTVALMTGEYHTCRGTITKQRTAQCYTAGDITDQFGVPLALEQIIPCGSDITETKLTIWDRSNTTPSQYEALTGDQCRTVCADLCSNIGLRLVTLVIDPCGVAGVTVKVAEICGKTGVFNEWSHVKTESCVYPTCEDNQYELETYTRTHECTFETQTEVRNGQKCERTICSDWSIWSVCDETFPAACEARFQERTRECACPGNQLKQFTQCPVVAEPAPTVTYGICSNPATGKDCGSNCMQEKVTDSICRGESRVMVPCDCSANPLIDQVGVCECPLEGEWPLGREWRWKINSNLACDASEQHDRMQYWCNTYQQDWLDWTTWTEPNDICFNKCVQFRYRCKTCDGESSPACAIKYGVDAVEELRECGGQNIQVSESECNSKCGLEGTKTIIQNDLCLGTTTSTVVPCTNAYTPPARTWQYDTKVFKYNNECCGGSQRRFKQAVFDQGTQCFPQEVETLVLPGGVSCKTVTEWSGCSKNGDGFCWQTRQIIDQCGAPTEVEQQPCTLGLGPWMVGNCNHYCDGTITSTREPICRNDNLAAYTTEEKLKTDVCGIVYNAPRLPQLDSTSIWTYAAAHFEPVSTVMWSACGMGVEAAAGEWATGVQFATRKTKCPMSVTPRGWEDVTIQRPCNPCASTPWGEWSMCSEVCSIGSRTRYRQCLDASGNVLQEKHGVHQTEACGANPILRRAVTECSAQTTCSNLSNEVSQCGMGTRNIIITAEHANGQLCPDALAALGSIIAEECDTGIPCTYWSAWNEPNMAVCHQEPSCIKQLERTRMCQGRSYKCDCVGPAAEAVSCGPLVPTVNGLELSTIASCRGQCHGTMFTRTQPYVCAPSVSVQEICPREMTTDIPGEWGEWNRTCGPCDQGVRRRIRASRCTGVTPPYESEEQQCVPYKVVPEWSAWDSEKCTICGGEMVRTRTYSCPSIWPTEFQYTLCPIDPAKTIKVNEFSTCSQVCWKDESLMRTFAIAGAAATTDQCGSTANAYSYSSIAAYTNLDPVRDAGAWMDDGIDMTSRPGFYVGYKGGWSMAEVVDICQNKVVGRKYKMCGNCKCPHRLAHSTTAVECTASTATCPYTASAAATAQCDTSVLTQPECAHIKIHPFFAENCGGNNQVSVQCRAESRSTIWSGYSPCRSATGRFCAAYDGEQGSQSRQRYAGCGTSCQLENDVQQCALPFTPAQITYTQWVEVQCAQGTGLGRMQRTKTVTNTCTGESVETVEEQGEDVSFLLNRFARTLSRDCPTNAKCGSSDGNVAYQEYTVFDRCLRSSSTERGDACRINVCPYFSAWQPWEACSKSCGEGVKRRIRYCVGGEVGEGYCRAGQTGGAELIQSASCNRGDCCNWEWSGWTGCCYNSVVSRHVRYRFQRNCGADEMVGKQGDCFANSVQASAAVQAQSVAVGADGVAVAAASVSNVAMTSCMSIGSDVNTWRMFHNPDPMQFSGGEFHMDSSSVVEVNTSDPVFAQISRAYAMASSWSGSASTVSGGFNTGSFGGYAWSMSGGKNLMLGTTSLSNNVPNTPVISQPVVEEPVMTHNVISDASASASANQSSAIANAQVSTSNNPWSNWFGNNNFIFG